MNTPTTQHDNNQKRSNLTIVAVCLTVVVGMVGAAYASVPLYRLFCQVTGFGGTTQTADILPDKVLDRVMTVRFDSNVDAALNWNFKPVERSVDVNVGEAKLAFYRAENKSNETIVGTASFNVTPLKAGIYFTKVDCFCFTEQVLSPGEVVDMPVTFFVDPQIAEDRGLDDVTTITLSYTFFRVDDPETVAQAKAEKDRQPNG